MTYADKDYILKALAALSDYHIEEGSKLYTIEEICDMIRKELNSIFPDFYCRKVVYTPNTDKQMFGIYIRPIFGADYIRKIFAGLDSNNYLQYRKDFEPFKFESYELEIDGKILSSNVLNSMQLLALLFNEISMYNATRPTSQVRAMIDTYIAKDESHLDLNKVEISDKTFKLVSSITMHNLCSAFARYGEDVSAPLQLTTEEGLGRYYTEAINLLKESVEWHQPLADTTAMMMVWYFKQYYWIHDNRSLEFVFRDALASESSKLVRKDINDALNQNIQILPTDKKYHERLIQESTKRKGLMWQMRRNGIKSIEEDLFEYTMRIKNVETEDDAIILMRQINSRMSILEDYLREEDIDDVDRKRWETCYSQYVQIRTELSKKTVYKQKQMGLWMDYNYLSDDERARSQAAYY